MNTPRTDAFEKQRIVEAATNDIATEAWADFARQLERENERLREALLYIKKQNERGYISYCGMPHEKVIDKALAAQPEEKTK